MTDILFSELGLAEPLERALVAREHTTPTPIQAQAIPKLLTGRDLIGIAQTGTGKTGAFSLPILHKLSRTPGENRPQSPRALILAPTRELAIQIGDEVRAYGKFVHLRQTVIFGGVSQMGQVKALSRGIEILIATPGRLLDLMNQGHIGLESVEHFIIDEADRMLDMGFVNDVRKILKALPDERQSILFSATMPDEIVNLSGEILTHPERVEVTPQATPVERIDQYVHYVDTGAKRDVLHTILNDPALERVIVFTRTKHRANRVAEQLSKDGFSSEAIHGNKSQGARQRALKQFRKGEVRILVATDIAARGIDIDGVTHVINFELPNEPDSYVHRIGRTARAGATGVAISFCDSSEWAYLRDIERLIRQELQVIGDKPDIPEVLPKTKGRPRSQNRRPQVKSMAKRGHPQQKRSSEGNRRGKPAAGGRRRKRAA